MVPPPPTGHKQVHRCLRWRLRRRVLGPYCHLDSLVRASRRRTAFCVFTERGKYHGNVRESSGRYSLDGVWYPTIDWDNIPSGSSQGHQDYRLFTEHWEYGTAVSERPNGYIVRNILMWCCLKRLGDNESRSIGDAQVESLQLDFLFWHQSVVLYGIITFLQSTISLKSQVKFGTF